MAYWKRSEEDTISGFNAFLKDQQAPTTTARRQSAVAVFRPVQKRVTKPFLAGYNSLLEGAKHFMDIPRPDHLIYAA